MSANAYRLIILALIVFAGSQQLLVVDYEQLNDRLDAALSACAGIKKVK